MIPHVIHYCWFGPKEKGPAEMQCIESWKKNFPDFVIKEWNENNFDVNALAYSKEAYAAGQYAFVSDVARLYALVNEGGIYFDTDVTVLKTFPQELFDYSAFAGFEMEKFIGTAVLACEPSHNFFKEILNDYKDRHFNLFLKNDTTSNVTKITNTLVSLGLVQNNTKQFIANILILPQSTFCNKNYETQEYYTSEESLAIHDFSGSWSKSSSIGRIWKLLHLPQTDFCNKIAKILRKLSTSSN